MIPDITATPTCANCAHCRVASEMDCPNQYYCGQNKAGDPPGVFSSEEEIKEAGWKGLRVTPELRCPNWKQRPIISALLDWEGRNYDGARWLEEDLTLAYNFVAYAMGPDPIDVYAIYYDVGILFYAYPKEGDHGIHAHVRCGQAKESVQEEKDFISMYTAMLTTPYQNSLTYKASEFFTQAAKNKFDRAGMMIKALLKVVKS